MDMLVEVSEDLLAGGRARAGGESGRRAGAPGGLRHRLRRDQPERDLCPGS